MASPPESPIEEVVYELEQTRVPKPIPVALEDLCRQTKFTKQEIRVMYRGFKTDLLVTLSTLLRGSVYERLRWTFKLYDLNGDGRISRSELSEIVMAIHELMGRRPHQPEDDRKARDQVDRVFRKLDLNQDGIITIEEFLEACLKDDLVTRSLQMFDNEL
uniref:EF-hand domain-containing protein n=1 Tax=Glossina brevipalpis TaxID=37001 RepID=A0A1A9W9D5_9MUSC